MKQNIWSRKNVKKQVLNYFELIREMINCFIMLISHKKNFSLMNWILYLHMYKMKIRYNINMNNMIEWRRNKLLFDYISFIMLALQFMMHKLIKMMWMKLLKNVLLLNVNKNDKIAEENSQLLIINWSSLINRIIIIISLIEHDVNNII